MDEQVEPQEKKKTPKGRAKKRITYTRRFVNVTMTGGKRKVRRGFVAIFSDIGQRKEEDRRCIHWRLSYLDARWRESGGSRSICSTRAA